MEQQQEQQSRHPWIGNLWQAAEDRFDAFKYSLATRLSGRDKLKICCYHSFGNAPSARLLGRVIEDPGDLSSCVDAQWWHNVVATVKRFASDEVPSARLELRCGPASTIVETDREGYFDIELPLPPLEEFPQSWSARLLSAAGYPSSYVEGLGVAQGAVTFSQQRAEFGVISDIDDTVLPSHATQWWRLVWKVLTENATTRLPFPGVSEFYRQLHKGSDGRYLNPLYYVSSSPWNLYDLLMEIFSKHGVPPGPLLLKDLGLGPDSRGFGNHGGKLEWICEILDHSPEMRFILIGDSGQRDAWIYHQVVEKYPNRVLAIYIRHVHEPNREPIAAIGNQLAEVGVPLLVMEDTHQAVEHAVAQGWIQPAATPKVDRQIEEDKTKEE